MAVIGIDLGGTKLAGAIFNNQGTILHQEIDAIENRKGSEVGDLIRNQIQRLLCVRSHKKTEIQAIGISVPGIYDVKNGTVWAPNIQGWEDYPLLREIQNSPDIGSLSVKIDSDRACYILGETWQGAAQGCRDAIFLAVGTGIGAGILIDGHVLRGHHDIAGAVGWLALDRPFKDGYSRCGCFEYQASGEGIVRTARELLKKDRCYSGILMKKNPTDLTSYDIFEAFKISDPIAIKVLDNCIALWGMAIANLISIFNPEKIILGGGIFGPAGQFLDRIRSEARQWAQPISYQRVTIEISILGGNAGLIGAGQLAFMAQSESS